MRNPSKKCRNGTRDRSVAACAMAARSTASCGDPDASMREPGAAGGHHVGVVPEDRQGVGGDAARRDVHAQRRELAGDLEQVRDHQQQALRRRERRGQRAGLQRPVQGARGAALGLHLDHVGHRAPQVRPLGDRPLLGVLAHRRRRGDRVDRDDLAQPVGDRRHRLVGVDRRRRRTDTAAPAPS